MPIFYGGLTQSVIDLQAAVAALQYAIIDLQNGVPVIGDGMTNIIYGGTPRRLQSWSQGGKDFVATYDGTGKIATLTTTGISVQTWTWSGNEIVSNPVVAL